MEMPIHGGLVLALCLSVAAVAVMLRLLDRLYGLESRQRHNDITGFMISVIAVIYAILLGFVTFTVWENYDKASAAVDAEVNLVADIHRDAGSLAASSATAVRAELTGYLATVKDQEWPGQMTGQCPPRRSALSGIAQHLRPASLDTVATAFIGEIVSRLNRLYDARRERLLACNRAIPTPIWISLAVGSLSLIGISLFFGCHDQRVHLALSATLTISIVLVLWVVFELSTPFRGSAAISPDIYKDMLDFLRSG